MDGRGENGGPDRPDPGSDRCRPAAADARPAGPRPGPTWRAWLLSIVAAIVLSVATMLLFGGSSRLTAASKAGAEGCGPCCAPGSQGER